MAINCLLYRHRSDMFYHTVTQELGVSTCLSSLTVISECDNL